MTLADLLRAGALGAYSGTGGQLVDTGVNLANLARAGYGVAGQSLGLLSPSQLPEPIDPSSVPGSSGNIKGLLGVGDSLPEQVAQFVGGLLTPGGTKNSAAKLEATVYHGTPHTLPPAPHNPLGAFDSSKIGTGEGAQAYGHGLYFADNPNVARMYQQRLATPDFYSIGLPTDLAQELEHTYLDMARSGSLHATNPSDAFDRVMQNQESVKKLAAQQGDFARYTQAMDNHTILNRASKEPLPGGRGSFYTVDIPDESIASMLHWEKPLSQQPQAVQQALGAADKDAGLVNTMPDMTGQQLYNELSLAMGGRDKAASFLNSQGVPGIRYLDAGSRGVGDGTYNTVLFNDALAKILKRE